CRLAGQRYYEALTASGVEVFEYQPTMMHAKVITMDGVVSLIGSTNFNRRSLDHDEEVMLAVMDRSFTAVLDSHYDTDLKVSDPIRTGRWKNRSLVQRAREAGVVPIRRFL
ncbi:phospholipase D-like domain-containing protein, partial [Streptomyces sp. NPDC054838]